MIWAREAWHVVQHPLMQSHIQFYDTIVAKCYNLPLWCELKNLTPFFIYYFLDFIWIFVKASKAFHVP